MSHKEPTGRMDKNGNPVMRTPARRHRQPSALLMPGGIQLPPNMKGLPADLQAAIDAVAAGNAGPGTELAIPDAPKKPTRRNVASPLGWIAVTGAAAAAARAAIEAQPLLHQLLPALITTAVFAGCAEWRARHVGADDRHRHEPAYYRWCARLAAGWCLAAVLAGTTGIPGLVNWLALIIGGLITAAPVLHDRSKKPPAEVVEEAPEDDPAAVALWGRFGQPGGLLDGATLTVVEHFKADGSTCAPGDDAAAGWRVHIHTAESSQVTGRTLQDGDFRTQVATMLDLPEDVVTVELRQGAKRSVRWATLTVLTERNADFQEYLWDGESTWDPERGTVEVVTFIDQTPGHWLGWVRGSGGFGGVFIGPQGSGKSTVQHKIISEYGLATMCAECGFEGTCPECNRQRVMSIWCGDPSMQPFGVWKGFADCTGWGPLASLGMLRFLAIGGRARAVDMGTMRWQDHLGRWNTGKGWFDPEVGRPLVYGFFDEWPDMVHEDAEWREEALSLAREIITKRRKNGIAMHVSAGLPDVMMLGERALWVLLKDSNLWMGRTDSHTRGMADPGMGHPGDLPKLAGVGYLGWVDGRQATRSRAQLIPERAKKGYDGPDVRGVAERIHGMGIRYDRAFWDAVTEAGWTGPGHVIEDSDVQLFAPEAGPAAPEPENPVAVADDLEGARVLVDVKQALEALTARDGAVDLYDLMGEVDRPAGPVRRAANILVNTGRAVKRGETCYAAVLSGINGGEVPVAEEGSAA